MKPNRLYIRKAHLQFDYATPKDIFDWLLSCETCGGSGIVEPPISGNDPHGAFANGPCPTCEGRGRRIPDKVVQATAMVRQIAGPPSPFLLELTECQLWAAVEAWEAE